MVRLIAKKVVPFLRHGFHNIPDPHNLRIELRIAHIVANKAVLLRHKIRVVDLNNFLDAEFREHERSV